MKNKKYLLIVGIVLLVSISFFLGFSVNKNKDYRNKNFQPSNEQGMKSFGGDKNLTDTKNQKGFGGMISGEIIKMDEKSITVKDKDNNSIIVTLSASTTFQKITSGSLDDIQIGSKVSVFGQSSTGFVGKAQTVQIN